MARDIPEPVRAAAGLAATLLDEARRLPATLPALPVRALGLAMQTSLRLQQEYSGLVARGDEVLTGLRRDGEPGLATFDDDLPDAPPAPRPPSGGLGSRDSAFDRVVEEPVTDYEDAEDSEDDTGTDTAVQAPPVVVDAAAAVGDDDLSDETLGEEELLAEGLTADLGDADLTDDEVADLPDDPEADEVTATVDELAVNMGENAAEDDAVIAASEQAIAAGHHEDEPTDGPADSPADEPVEGYDGFSIAQLRGRLRGYQPVTVTELLGYEQAHQARAPFLALLRNRQEKLDRERG